jgi:hypothetical protein
MLKTNFPESFFTTRPRQNAVGLANGVAGREEGLLIFLPLEKGARGIFRLIE